MSTTAKRFHTFEGVFTPCLLSILGVIMYLRLGFVVGSVGLTGALIIIVFANLITLATALSMSSVVTNIRIGTGGAYSMISKSLGIEAGGAIGVPLYIAQAISVAFYIAGFAECWAFVFPLHNSLLVSLIAWLVIVMISYISTKLAFRIQFFIIALILLSIVSMMVGNGGEAQTIVWQIGSIEKFWQAFAIFFPAVTGILAGAAMSGELIDPRKSIPKGTLWAIVVSFIIYVFLAYLFAQRISVAELQNNNTVAIEMGRWSWMVIAGILGATLSSAISMFISSPRILLALSKHSIIPFSQSFIRVNKKGEPTTAILLTSLIVLIMILYSSLDQIAGLLTMFFLITYGMINFIVFIEQTIGIASFRPSFRVSRWVTFFGGISCLTIMLLINIKFSLAAILVIVGLYFILIKKEAQVYSPDIRSGMLVFLAEKMAKMASALPYYPKIWKPNLLVLTNDLKVLPSVANFIRAVLYPAGRLTTILISNERFENLSSDKEDKDKSGKDIVNENLALSLRTLKEDGIFVETAAVEAEDYLAGTTIVMQTLKGMFFPPNTLFYILDQDKRHDKVAKQTIERATAEGLGIIVLAHNLKVGFAQEQIVNLWIRKQSPNINLSVLVTLQLERNWEGLIRLVQVVDSEAEVQEARQYLEKLKSIMRLPLNINIEVLVGEFKDVTKQAPPADINILGMPDKPDIKVIREVALNTKTPVLFLRDSKHESALA